VLARARGFVYYVSLTGVTGAGGAPLVEAGRAAIALRKRARLPVAVGFGIDSREKARLVAEQGVDGVVVGTAVVRAISGAADDAGRASAVRKLVSELRAALEL
jgi:tryptophan synthase alpha chain